MPPGSTFILKCGITGVRPFGGLPRAAACTGPYAMPHQRSNMLSHAPGWRGGFSLMPPGSAFTPECGITGVRPFAKRNFHP
jgi:hypothetical protein